MVLNKDLKKRKFFPHALVREQKQGNYYIETWNFVLIQSLEYVGELFANVLPKSTVKTMLIVFFDSVAIMHNNSFLFLEQ